MITKDKTQKSDVNDLEPKLIKAYKLATDNAISE